MKNPPAPESRSARQRSEPLRALITSGGGPGVWGLLAALRTLPTRRATILVHDPAAEATLGTLFADRAARLPPATDAGYVAALLDFCLAEHVDVLIPVYDGELSALAAARAEFERRGTSVLLPPHELVEVCRDKGRTYAALTQTIYPPAFRVARTTDETLAAIAALEYPRRILAVRPIDLAGGRGLHILDARSDVFREHLLSKPGPHHLSAEEFLRIRAAGPRDFPLLISEYLPGEELGIDLLAERGQVVEMVIRRKGGPMLHGNPALIGFAERRGEREWVAGLTGALGLCGLVSIDARYDAAGTLRLLEVNPRPGAYIGMSCTRLHLLGWAIDRLLGAGAGQRATYVGDETLTHGLRAFGDVVYAPRPGVAHVLAPDLGAANEDRVVDTEDTKELSHARRVPCSAPR